MLSDSMMLGGGRKAAFSIDNSLLFRGGQYLSRTPSVAGNRRAGTFHVWARRARTGGTGDTLIAAILGGNQRAHIYWDANNKFSVFFAVDGVNYQWISAGSYRDLSAWYNVVVGWDTVAQVLSAEINGQPVAWSQSATLPVNAELAFGAVCPHTIGAWWDGAAYSYHMQGYQAEPLLVVGTRYTASRFGELDSVTRSWRPKKLANINFGPNGFQLGKPWASANLGADASGLGNNWTPNGFAATDVVKDSPTNVHAVLSLLPGRTVGLAEGNLQFVSSAPSHSGYAFGTLAMSRGKWFWEVTVAAVYNGSYPGSGNTLGIVDAGTIGGPPGSETVSQWLFEGYTGHRSRTVMGRGVEDTVYGPAWNTVGDVIGVALDMDAGRLYFSKNGAWADGSGAVLSAFNAEIYAYDGIVGSIMPLLSDTSSTDSWSANVNFGQRPFVNAPPAGFNALCTANLPATSGQAGGSFAGNGSADGPCVYTGAVPLTLTVNGNAVTWGVHADKLAIGFKIRTASTGYNSTGTNTWTATYDRKPTVGPKGRAPANAQVN